MSIFDHPDTVSAAPSWRCPHCRTLQAEATRCWACSRAALTCSTCHLYRTSVAADLGYCARDRARTPLSGDDVRSCWEASPAVDGGGLFGDLEAVAVRASLHSPALTAPPSPGSLPAIVRDREVRREQPLSGGWVEASPVDRLVEAPSVAPGRRLMSELERRSRRSRRG